MISSKDLRQKYLDFFRGKGHAIISSASLIPENDPTVLFTTAGMHPLVPYLLGEKHPTGKRLASAQKCLRTDDIDEVGDTRHHTLFEMMGNWSLGDYFKKDSIAYSWEFLTSSAWLNLDKKRLAVSVFAGDADAPFDQESYDLWLLLGVPAERIAKLPKKNNWWGPAGLTGPCGPDTEIFYWSGDPSQIPDSFNDDNEFWVEIWNNVFMEYNKTAEGKYVPLSQKNVDTGLGLERVSAVLNNLSDDYQTDLFINLIRKIEELSGHNYDENEETKKAMRVIADHLKAAVFLIGDDKGLVPSNTDQGYVIRRLIRRAIRYGFQIGIKKQSWAKELAEIVIEDYGEFYSELKRNELFIFNNLEKESNKFEKTLEKGLKILNTQLVVKDASDRPFQNIPTISVVDGMLGLTPEDVSGKWLFDVYQTFGFPLELSLEEIRKMRRGLSDFELKRVKDEFEKEMKKHQDLSRTAAAGKFKGGLADSTEETTKLHTAAHLLLAALRRVLGDHVVQKGSNITAERLRLDFSHPEKMTPEQIREVERLVNEEIQKDDPVILEEMTVEEAKKQGAMGVFDSKYGEIVKVYTVGDFSKEICGGPHVEHTGALGLFKIQKEEASSAGVRRIKAQLVK